MRPRLYLRQLLSGRDFAREDPTARQMANFCYLVGDRERREALLVDPAWDVPGLVEQARRDEMNVVGALVTHYHPDHVGGSFFGHTVQGVAELLATDGVQARVHVHRAEADGVKRVTGVSESDLVRHDGDEEVMVGDVGVRLLHTPGHTPGSQCFLVDGNLIAGDTLFVSGCGRVDLPGGDADEMYRTLTERLAKLPDDVVLYPGHHYAEQPSATLADQRRSNHALRVTSLDQWRRLMGADRHR